MAFIAYTPELGQKRPIVDIEARLSHYGRHYFIKSKNPINIKQGVKFLGKLNSSSLVPTAQRKVGWYEYQMTEKAFSKLCKKTNVGCEMPLD